METMLCGGLRCKALDWLSRMTSIPFLLAGNYGHFVTKECIRTAKQTLIHFLNSTFAFSLVRK